jgi:glycosyltransferase involved in cell wall biosynthesis
MEPLVSIVIPLYNQGEFLSDSVGSVLSQTYKNIEVIIVEDGSTDGTTPDIADKFQSNIVRVIHKKNEGLAMARNTGIEDSKGEFVIPLDADDKLDPTFVEKTISSIQENNNIAVVYTDQMFFGEENKIMEMKDFDFSYLLVQNHVSVCSLIRKSMFEKVKSVNGVGYNPNMKFGYEDWDFWISVGELGGEFRCVHEPLFHYRKRASSMSSNTLKNHEYLVSVMFENHKETFSKYQKEIYTLLQNLFFDREKSLADLRKETSSPLWLQKKFLKNIFGEK